MVASDNGNEILLPWKNKLLQFFVRVYIYIFSLSVHINICLACKWPNYLETVPTQPKKAKADFASKTPAASNTACEQTRALILIF